MFIARFLTFSPRSVAGEANFFGGLPAAERGEQRRHLGIAVGSILYAGDLRFHGSAEAEPQAVDRALER
ncbi:MAG: hypothetical protein R3F11_11395 [Verrucomicrobiales bacterium]